MRNSAISCYILESKAELKMHFNNLGRLPPKNGGPNTTYFWTLFDDFETPNSTVKIFGKKYDINNYEEQRCEESSIHFDFVFKHYYL